jgi:hypothetical protein
MQIGSSKALLPTPKVHMVDEQMVSVGAWTVEVI